MVAMLKNFQEGRLVGTLSDAPPGASVTPGEVAPPGVSPTPVLCTWGRTLLVLGEDALFGSSMTCSQPVVGALGNELTIDAARSAVASTVFFGAFGSVAKVASGEPGMHTYCVASDYAVASPGHTTATGFATKCAVGG